MSSPEAGEACLVGLAALAIGVVAVLVLVEGIDFARIVRGVFIGQIQIADQAPGDFGEGVLVLDMAGQFRQFCAGAGLQHAAPEIDHIAR